MNINIINIVMSLELSIFPNNSIKKYILFLIEKILDIFWFINYDSILLTGIFILLLIILINRKSKNQACVEVAVAIDETRVIKPDERKKSLRVQAAENADKAEIEFKLKKSLSKKYQISEAEQRENARRYHNILYGTNY